MAEEKKLTKKQLKTLEFKNKRKAPESEPETKAVLEQTKPVIEESSAVAKTESGEEPVKKKRKTRRGRGGRPRQNADSNIPRFLLFVGGIGRDCTIQELQKIFKTSKPDAIRYRPDKGIAFLEFQPAKMKTKEEKDLVEIEGKEVEVDASVYASEIQKRMDIALLQDGRMIRDRKIKVELTVGGGGNSEHRKGKLNSKNNKMDIERTIRMNQLRARAMKKPEPKKE